MQKYYYFPYSTEICIHFFVLKVDCCLVDEKTVAEVSCFKIWINFLFFDGNSAIVDTFLMQNFAIRDSPIAITP